MDIRPYICFEYYDGSKEYINKDTQLAKIFTAQKKYLSIKWEHYLEIYDRHLRYYLKDNQAINLLEIGVLNGGSLETWKNYLPYGSKIWGIDINPRCTELDFSEGITFIHGSGTDRELLYKNFKKIDFDVIIDDGSHKSSDVITTFELLFPRLKHGGLYIVEDTHASYWKNFQGGYKKENSTIEYFKKIVDIIHYKYLDDEEKNKLSAEENLSFKALNQEIANISFYDSVIIIEKYLQKRKTHFRHYLSDGEGKVVSREAVSSVSIECNENTTLEKIYK